MSDAYENTILKCRRCGERFPVKKLKTEIYDEGNPALGRVTHFDDRTERCFVYSCPNCDRVCSPVTLAGIATHLGFKVTIIGKRVKIIDKK